MDNLRGIALMTIAMAFFALGDMTIKWAAPILPLGLSAGGGWGTVPSISSS